MAEAVKRYLDLSEDELAEEYLFAKELRRMDWEAELEYKWEEGIKKGEKQGKAEGMEKGMEKGKTEAREKAALNMLSAGFSLDDILICTELSVDRLEELKKTQVK